MRAFCRGRFLSVGSEHVGAGPSRRPSRLAQATLADLAREVFSSAWSKDEVQGLPFGRGDIRMPQVHHENHPWAILRGTWDGGERGEVRTARSQDPRSALQHRSAEFLLSGQERDPGFLRSQAECVTGAGRGRGEWKSTRHRGTEAIPCGPVTVHTCHHTFVKTHRTHNAE